MTPGTIRAIRNTAFALGALAALTACAGLRGGASADPQRDLNGPDMFSGLGLSDLLVLPQDGGWGLA